MGFGPAVKVKKYHLESHHMQLFLGYLKACLCIKLYYKAAYSILPKEAQDKISFPQLPPQNMTSMSHKPKNTKR